VNPWASQLPCGYGTAFHVSSSAPNKASCVFWKVSDVEVVVRCSRARRVFEDYDMPEMESVDRPPVALAPPGSGQRRQYLRWFRSRVSNAQRYEARLAFPFAGASLTG
jgi:hypothetical protein